MQRREFLWLLAASLLWRPARAESRRVLVIGAGMAGLTAAHQLRAQGHQVTVIEGRNRLGGRIHTSTAWPQLPVDLGASWIHGIESNPLMPLVRAAGARTALTHYQRYRRYDAAGHPMQAAEEARLDALWDEFRRALKQARRQTRDGSVAAVAETAFGSLSAADRQRMAFLLSANIEQEEGGSAAQLSARYYDDYADFGGADALFADGYRVLIDYQAHGLDLQLNQQVEAVDWRGPELRVSCGSRSFFADQVVVTLPLGVLKTGAIRFHPPLPAPKQAAIDAIGMGLLDKTFLRFGQSFWPTEADWLEQIPAQAGAWSEWLSYARVSGQPVLLGFNAADRAREIESWSDAAIVADALVTLRRLFGPIPAPQAVQITRWGADPFARGAYSYNALGATPAQRERLAEPLEQRLFFAGEATERHHFATVHGAYLSGLRVARELHAGRSGPAKRQ